LWVVNQVKQPSFLLLPLAGCLRIAANVQGFVSAVALVVQKQIEKQKMP
jgi:hypothetical protein